MLFALALIPVVGLLLFIYFNDKTDRVPFGYLIALFFIGMGTVVSAIIIEGIGKAILDAAIPYESMFKGAFLAIAIVGPTEELGKFLVLRLMTWKSRHFKHTYDAIVFAVFVSLGFAALENVGYVFGGGIGAALLRMFTAVPGHACFAVFMGLFYGKAKLAQVNGKTGMRFLNYFLSLFVPIVIHGIYDAILMAGGSADEFIVTGLSVVLWIGFIIALFAVSFIVIIISSRHDIRLVTEQISYDPIYQNKVSYAGANNMPNYGTPNVQPTYQTPSYQPSNMNPAPAFVPVQGNYASSAPVQQPQATVQAGSMYATGPMQPQPSYIPQQPSQPSQPKPAFVPVAAATAVAASWTCSCGSVCSTNFCTQCGKKRPVDNSWTCPRCGRRSTMNFCGSCGTPKS